MSNRLNINPHYWGHHAWIYLFAIAMTYPELASEDMIIRTRQFLQAQELLIPCENCRNNYCKHLKKYPLSHSVLESKSGLLQWLVNVKNEVNLSLGKPKQSYNQMIQYYNNKLSDKKNKFYYMKFTVFIILFLLLLSLSWFLKSKII